MNSISKKLMTIQSLCIILFMVLFQNKKINTHIHLKLYGMYLLLCFYCLCLV